MPIVNCLQFFDNDIKYGKYLFVLNGEWTSCCSFLGSHTYFLKILRFKISEEGTSNIGRCRVWMVRHAPKHFLGVTFSSQCCKMFHILPNRGRLDRTGPAPPPGHAGGHAPPNTGNSHSAWHSEDACSASSRRCQVFLKTLIWSV